MEKRYGQANICPGKLLNCVVRSINHESRAVTLIPFKAAAEDTLKTSNLPFLSLIPGMLFDVVVEKIVEVILWRMV